MAFTLKGEDVVRRRPIIRILISPGFSRSRIEVGGGLLGKDFGNYLIKKLHSIKKGSKQRIDVVEESLSDIQVETIRDTSFYLRHPEGFPVEKVVFSQLLKFLGHNQPAKVYGLLGLETRYDRRKRRYVMELLHREPLELNLPQGYTVLKTGGNRTTVYLPIHHKSEEHVRKFIVQLLKGELSGKQ